MSGQGVAICSIPTTLVCVSVEVGRSRITAMQSKPGEKWSVRFDGLEQFATIRADATREQVRAALLRFLVGIE